MKIGVRGKLFAVSLLVIASVGLISGAFLETKLRAFLEARLEREVIRQAHTMQVALGTAGGPSDSAADEMADRLGDSAQARITIIGLDGTVRGDSMLDRKALLEVDNHGQRQEVVAALANGLGLSRRFSATLHTDMLYVAVPFPSAAKARGVVRVALPMRDIDAAIAQLRMLLVLAGAVGLGLAVLMSALASELTSRTLRELATHARAVVRGQQSSGLSTRSGDELGRLAGSFNRIADELQDAVAEFGKERDRLQRILAQMTDAVLALDAEDRVVLANRATERLLGLTSADIGRPMLDAARVPALMALLDRCRREQEATEEFELSAPQRRVVIAQAASLSAIQGTMVVMHDVTEVRQLERVRRDFVANVSHELRTPVSVIRANAETLIEGGLEDPTQCLAFVQAIDRNAHRLTHLISDLLDLSRIEAGQGRLELTTVNLVEALSQSIDNFAGPARDKGVAIELNALSELEAKADPSALAQILDNLLDNAVKYAKPDGQIRVRAEAEASCIRIEIEDDGPGVPLSQRERVFERFYRVDPGRSRQLGGTGLGLSIVKHLSESMGGRVGVSPAPKQGATFWLQLPSANNA